MCVVCAFNYIYSCNFLNKSFTCKIDFFILFPLLYFWLFFVFSFRQLAYFTQLLTMSKLLYLQLIIWTIDPPCPLRPPARAVCRCPVVRWSTAAPPTQRACVRAGGMCTEATISAMKRLACAPPPRRLVLRTGRTEWCQIMLVSIMRRGSTF